MELLSYLAMHSAFTKTSATYCMRELTDKIGDYRSGEFAKEALSCIAEACTLQYVSLEVGGKSSLQLSYCTSVLDFLLIIGMGLFVKCAGAHDCL